VRGEQYQRTSSYPLIPVSCSYSILNVFGFRKRNWRFDAVGGFTWGMLIFSCLPLCDLTKPIVDSPTWTQAAALYLQSIYKVHAFVLSETYVSLISCLMLLITLIGFTEEYWPIWKRGLVGTCHFLLHSIGAYSTLLFVECGIDFSIKNGILQPDLLFNNLLDSWSQGRELLSIADEWTFGIVSKLISMITSIFDIPSAVAAYKNHLCVNRLSDSYFNVSRFDWIVYYTVTSLYLWIVVTPLVSFVMGTYLYISGAFLNSHLTESFSSLRIESFKNFIRFHINSSGDLEVYVLGLDRVAKNWSKDVKWSGLTIDKAIPSYEWSNPSVFKPADGQPDKIRLVDYFVIYKSKLDNRTLQPNCTDENVSNEIE